MQINLLRTMNIKPNFVFMLSISEEQCLKHVSTRRIDPVTGDFFNMNSIKFTDKELTKKLFDAIGENDKLQILGLEGVETKILKVLVEDMADSTPIEFEAFKRLKVAAEDQPELIQKRYQVWKNNYAMYEDNFTENVHHIDVEEMKVHEIFNFISRHILAHFA
mmetsp:Transcript_15199/g.25722  ORF Transcript_15199/g.25722 Transcript_15199/m.25722 type:complete len:163 (+) Transcript_15199:1035-1523(+)